jgi:hypothetical protein
MVVSIGVNDVAENDVTDVFGTSTPERATASRTHVAAISLGGESFRLPPYPPIAVRTPLRITISLSYQIRGKVVYF